LTVPKKLLPYLSKGMEIPTINVFTHRYIAIRKPRKNTLYFFYWSSNSRSWIPYTPVSDEEGIKQYSNDYSLAHVALHINTDKRQRWDMPTSTRSLVNFEAVGKYVKWRGYGNGNTFTAPVLDIRKIPNTTNSVPERLKFPEFEVNPATNPLVATNLWTVDAGPPPLLVPPPRPRRTHTIPKRIAQIILEDAVNKGEVCPITMDDINISTSKITSCFHIFDGPALDTWLSNKAECPVCKEACITLMVV